MGCRKFKSNSKTIPITSRNIPKKGALYTIKKGNRSKYDGQTNDLKQRTGRHLNGRRQKIDRYLDRTNLRNVGLEYTPMRNPERYERQYMDCTKKREGKSSLPYNLTRGNTVPRKNPRRRRRRWSKKKSNPSLNFDGAPVFHCTLVIL